MSDWGHGSIADHMRAEHKKGEDKALAKLADYISSLQEKVAKLEKELGRE